MIQRIQSLLILISALLSFMTFYFTFGQEIESIAIKLKVFLFIAIVSMMIIFLFNYRKIQARICLILYLAHISIIFYYLIYLIMNEKNLEFTYLIIISCFTQLVLIFFARKAILKDENLIRSVDRIR